MKRLCTFVLAIIPISGFAQPIDTHIEIRNTYSSLLHRGECSVVFDLVAYDFLDNVRSITFNVEAKNKKGNTILKENNIVVDSEIFNMVSGKTYASFFLEGKEACDAIGENLIIKSAIVRYSDGTPNEDIVKNKKLAAQDFKPMKILIK